jgi:hypothetical protein
VRQTVEQVAVESPLLLTLTTGVYPDTSRQYNAAMYKMGIALAIAGMSWASMLLASEEQHPQVPGVNERLNRALGSEGGVQVYKDPAGNPASRHGAAAAKSIDEPRPSPAATQPTTTIASGHASYPSTRSRFSAEGSLNHTTHDGSSVGQT